MKFALLSVSDKAGLVPFARALVDAGYTLLSTGGTASALKEAGLPVTKVSDHTGAPEIFDGRVKTLHPRIHGGILGDRGKHAAEAERQGIPWIDVVAVNLYPFERTVGGGATLADAIENIDIGGPTMVRASAKNHAHVTIVTDPADYDRVAAAIGGGGTSLELRRELAVKAFRHTARYDAVIQSWLANELGIGGFPAETALGLKLVQTCRYGENPHQQAAFYADPDTRGRSLARLVQHQGKELSFNNLADLDGAVRIAFDFHPTSRTPPAAEGGGSPLDAGPRPACAIIKHMNPCGAAVAATTVEAFEHALAGDPVSAFGGIVAFNRVVDGDLVRAIKLSKVFFEVLVAPGFTPDALEKLASRENLRVIELPGDWADSRPPGHDARRIQGGWLLQDWDLGIETEWKVVSRRAPTDAQLAALRFAWAACRNVKSNAITLARSHATGAALNGVGAGQMSRVDSVRLAVSKATKEVAGNVLASDAFFPFPDGVEVAVQAGVAAIVQPGGSVRDAEVVAVADAHDVVMIFTGARHFRH